ncbi:hypothetical protein TCE0_022r06321 [Talaromyces pinophilus]|jgi:hypothetical protein|uniref:Uncharacterized protein n=1 Tax=Talaromyces pinophilus TaxID=128442 RepID=A0A6V8H878_TALPI|nr:hypothetical protein TCE0_022r06321 [Talaromyces pinophilus]
MFHNREVKVDKDIYGELLLARFAFSVFSYREDKDNRSRKRKQDDNSELIRVVEEDGANGEDLDASESTPGTGPASHASASRTSTRNRGKVNKKRKRQSSVLSLEPAFDPCPEQYHSNQSDAMDHTADFNIFRKEEANRMSLPRPHECFQLHDGDALS